MTPQDLNPAADWRAVRIATALLHAVCALALCNATTSVAADPALVGTPKAWDKLKNEAAQVLTREPAEPRQEVSVEPGLRKNYSLPALEIIGFDLLLNLHNRIYVGDDYKSNLPSIRRNLTSSWVVDNDPFRTNQLGHPYQGSIYHNFARSAGLDFWESLGYTFAGSAFWEVAGEKVPPSKNDQINTGVGGAFLGEALFRLSSLMIENSDGIPRLWREAGAALISPAAGFNRLVFHDRMDALFASRNPAYYSRLQVGFSGTAKTNQGISSAKIKANEALADFSIDYGLPGKAGYAYSRPFDYFNLQATASSANGFENVMTRGMLIGRAYEAGSSIRGIAGLYGSYDYIAPQIFRVSSTALSLGSTAEFRLSDSLALQGTAMAGMGYAAVGATRSNATAIDYRYGWAPQALVAMRMIFGKEASLDLTAREYFVTDIAGPSRGGHDNIVRVDASFTLRIAKGHAVTLKYLGNRRDASFSGAAPIGQSRATVGIFYTMMGQDGFGHVAWE